MTCFFLFFPWEIFYAIRGLYGEGSHHQLTLQQEKVEWYERLGFISKGPSAVQFGGGNWIDMVSLFALSSIPTSFIGSLMISRFTR
jgi:hypothetical protein